MNHLSANRRVASVIDAIVRATRPGDYILTEALRERINNQDVRRNFTARRVGMLLRAREDLIYIKAGAWVVK